MLIMSKNRMKCCKLQNVERMFYFSDDEDVLSMIENGEISIDHLIEESIYNNFCDHCVIVVNGENYGSFPVKIGNELFNRIISKWNSKSEELIYIDELEKEIISEKVES